MSKAPASDFWEHVIPESADYPLENYEVTGGRGIEMTAYLLRDGTRETREKAEYRIKGLTDALLGTFEYVSRSLSEKTAFKELGPAGPAIYDTITVNEPCHSTIAADVIQFRRLVNMYSIENPVHIAVVPVYNMFVGEYKS